MSYIEELQMGFILYKDKEVVVAVSYIEELQMGFILYKDKEVVRSGTVVVLTM